MEILLTFEFLDQDHLFESPYNVIVWIDFHVIFRWRYAALCNKTLFESKLNKKCMQIIPTRTHLLKLGIEAVDI